MQQIRKAQRAGACSNIKTANTKPTYTEHYFISQLITAPPRQGGSACSFHFEGVAVTRNVNHRDGDITKQHLDCGQDEATAPHLIRALLRTSETGRCAPTAEQRTGRATEPIVFLSKEHEGNLRGSSDKAIEQPSDRPCERPTDRSSGQQRKFKLVEREDFRG